LPETVQIAVVVEAKLTGSPEVAVALKVSVPGPTPNVRSERGENEMLWVGSWTAKLRGAAAAAQSPLPACVAVMVQVPAAFSVAVLPDTVQTTGVDDAKVTGSPELAEALRVIDPVLNSCAGMTGNVRVCSS